MLQGLYYYNVHWSFSIKYLGLKLYIERYYMEECFERHNEEV